jgi:hypothetical protein
MKNNVLFLILFFSFAINAQELPKLPKDQMNSIKYEYNWKTEKFLIINYRFLAKDCSYDNYGELKKTYDWFNEFIYSKLDSTLFRSVFVYADKLAAKEILDDQQNYADIGHYFLKNFFNQKNNCYGILVINKIGSYKVILGDYSKKDVENMLEALK